MIWKSIETRSLDGQSDGYFSGHTFQETTLPKVQKVAVNATPQPQSSPTPTMPKTAVPPSPVTPQTNTSAVPAQQPSSSGSGRMVTRVSSGAIRHKSIGELLGQQEVTPPPDSTYSRTKKQFTPKHTSSSRSTEMTKDQIEALAAGYAIPLPIPKPPQQQQQPQPQPRSRGQIFQDTTLTTLPSTRVDLDRIQATAEVCPLDVIIRTAHKSLRTTDHLKNVNERQNLAIIARINELKGAGLWSLRQPMKQRLPSRGLTHWDYMLKEMEWLATDFYEERKFKVAGAYLISRAVRAFFQAEDKEGFRHKVCNVWILVGC
jgi:chromatin modification-related protein VID21